MDISIRKDPFLYFFFICLGFFVLLVSVFLFLIFWIEEQESASSKKAYQSLLIAQEMRQSSDDLTKMVRLYVLTGDPKYIEYYNEILAIRNGTMPRPVAYNEIYWDLVLEGKKPRESGPAISLKQMMKNEGFTEKEFNLIEESQVLSDTLTSLEIEAIHLMEGKYNNGSGDFSVSGPPDPALARALVSNEAYMKEKAKIMAPLYVFSLEVKARTLEQVEALRKKSVKLIGIGIFLSVLSVLSMILSVIKSLKMIKKSTQVNERLLLNMFPEQFVQKLKQGDGVCAYECEGSILFMHIHHFSENFSADMIGQLFDIFQNLADEHGIEKVKLLGDNFMAISGVPTPAVDHVLRIANYAWALREKIALFSKEGGLDLSIRSGIATGVVKAGIVGTKQFIYDVWGDTVAMANFLQETGEIGQIHVSQEMKPILESMFVLEKRAPLEALGQAEMVTYTIKAKK